MAEKTLGEIARDKWRDELSLIEHTAKESWQAVADAVVAAHEARRWRPISEAAKDGGKTWVIGRGKYAHPFDPAFDDVTVAQIYFNRLYQEWLDTQGARFSPDTFTTLPAPPKEGE